MGRIKTKLVKRKTKELIKAQGDKFNSDYDHNKKVAATYMDFPSKKIRNVIAGYLTRLKRKEA